VFVEDSDVVRRVTRAQLTQLGYTVLPFATGTQALAGAAAYPGEIHLLLTDVVMPQMNGRTLAERLCSQRPGVRVLYVSGYTDDVIGQHGVLEPGTFFLAKPFRMRQLATKLREVLGHGPAGDEP
jgi:CheY-like chemotaxis protein